MRTIGLIGGMSRESSAHYYRIVNQAVRGRLGPSHSARLLLFSLDFAGIEQARRAGDWAALAGTMADAARRLERGGADFLLLCTNTMHRLADEIAALHALAAVELALDETPPGGPAPGRDGPMDRSPRRIVRTPMQGDRE